MVLSLLTTAPARFCSQLRACKPGSWSWHRSMLCAGPTLHTMEARQLQSQAQVAQLSREMKHLQEALSMTPQHAIPAAQQPAAWPAPQNDALEHSVAEMSRDSAGSQLNSHPVSVTPDVSPVRMLPLSMAGNSTAHAEIPATVGVYNHRTNYADALDGSLTVPVLFPESAGDHR